MNSFSTMYRMRCLVIVLCSAVAVLGYAPISLNYHEDIGIPLAHRIRLAEEARDFDGARIVGGQAAALGDHPHLGGLLIHLTDGRTSLCGSSLLTNTRLVTAAHCWRYGNIQARYFTVVLGSLYLYTGGVRIDTDDVEMHPDYYDWTMRNDVAIIRISHVPYSNIINRVLLPTGNDSYVGVWATAAGYGRASDSSPVSIYQEKRQVNLNVITNQVCASVYGSDYVTDSTLCTSGVMGQNICSGDSGGPLAIGTGTDRVLIGITSFASGAGCENGLPGGFSRVTSFTDWINSRL